MTQTMVIIWVAFALAQIADIITTRKVLAQGGRELNPVIAFFMDKFGKNWWVAKMLIGIAAAAYLSWAGYLWGVAVLSGLTALVALNNWRQVK